MSVVHHLLSLLAAASLVLGHAKPESPEELTFRLDHEANVKRSLGECGEKLTRRDINVARAMKRDIMIENHLRRLGMENDASIKPRDFIYDGANSSCILTPEGEEGPYYVNGSTIRQDIRETQEGVPLLLDVQLLDVRTCSPLADVMLDFWSANSTGVYSNEESEGTLGETQLRGIRKTDEFGLAQVITVVPGWYSGRAQHIHVKAHVNYTVYDNDTISFGNIPHTGQMFFLQSSLTDINENYPYTLDSNPFTLNTEDRVIQDQQNTTYYDAFIEMRSIGYNVTAGLVGYINIAIDPTAEPAGAGGNAPGGPGGAPTGTMTGTPSGTATATA